MTVLAASLVARLGVIWLDNRFDQDNIRLGNYLLDMLSFSEIQAVLFQFSLEFIGEGHLGGATNVIGQSNWVRAYPRECMVRIRISPTASHFKPSMLTFLPLTQYSRSVKIWVGCSPQPSPPLMIGTDAHLAASCGRLAGSGA